MHNNQNETELSLSTWRKHLDDVLTAQQKLGSQCSLAILKSEAVDPEKMFDTTVLSKY